MSLKRLRLKPFFQLIPLTNGKVQLRSTYRSVVVSDTAASGLLERVLELLDGSRTIHDLERECASSNGQLQRIIRLLREKGLVEEVDPAMLGERPADPQQLLFSAFVGDPVSCNQALAQARVAVVGDSALAEQVVDQLNQMKLGSVERLDSEDVLRRYSLYGDKPTIERCRSDSLEYLAPFHFVVACSCTQDVRLFKAVNLFCMAAQKPWLGSSAVGVEIAVGPLVIPGDTACLTCYELRIKGNLNFADEYIAFEQHLVNTNGSGVRPQGALVASLVIAAGLTALETTKYIARYMYPISAGNALRLNLVNYSLRVNHVLRVPRCPTCSVSLPVVKEWELCATNY